ncbi:MAG: hypothetical protein KIC54_03845 [Clostridium sp.]|nr:hypothetical protein [Clostridium sp.]
MSKYTYSTNDREIEHLNKKVFILLMKLGFKLTSIGTVYLKNIILISYINKNDDLSYSQCIKILSKEINKSAVTIKSNIFKCFDTVDKKKYVNVFPQIFKYDTDISSITPLNLYESFSALLQLKDSTI